MKTITLIGGPNDGQVQPPPPAQQQEMAVMDFGPPFQVLGWYRPGPDPLRWQWHEGGG